MSQQWNWGWEGSRWNVIFIPLMKIENCPVWLNTDRRGQQGIFNELLRNAKPFLRRTGWFWRSACGSTSTTTKNIKFWQYSKSLKQSRIISATHVFQRREVHFHSWREKSIAVLWCSTPQSMLPNIQQEMISVPVINNIDPNHSLTIPVCAELDFSCNQTLGNWKYYKFHF